MRIGSLFSGIGGLDLAVERATGGTTAWQVESNAACIKVLGRHWPDARQVDEDVQLVDPNDLEQVDCLCFGFPCVDLSTAGSGKGLEGERSGLYREGLRFVEAQLPALVVIENVPRLLSRYREVVDADLHALGYGVTWVKISAADVGAPHLRRRVFVIAQRGQGGSTVMTADRGNLSDLWPTPTCGDAKASGSRSLAGSGAHTGTSLTDALWSHRTTAETARWSTPTSRDYRTGGDITRKGGPSLPAQLDGKLNPDFIEQMQGLPVGWTLTEGPCQHGEEPSAWPAGRVKGLDGASPQHPWEEPRLMPRDRPVRGRPGRLRALGNLVVPTQGEAAIRLALAHKPAQGVLL